MKKYLLIVCLSLLSGAVLAQQVRINERLEAPRKAGIEDLQMSISQKNMKSAGVPFWEEQFDWGDTLVERGWTLPEGWALDNWDDTGYHWQWFHADDTLRGSYTTEPVMLSTSHDNGVLGLNVDGYNADIANYGDYLAVNSSITSPVIDCSQHSSVLVKLEQRFRYWSNAIQTFEVTNDNGVHWAAFDMGMGTLINETVGGAAAQESVELFLNISDVAAGMANVQFRITWNESRLYYWMIDDIVFMEGWDNDLQLLYSEADYDNDNPDDPEGFFYEIPKSQLSSYQFSSVLRNFGNNEQWGTHMNVKVMKNNAYIWDQSTEPYVSYPLVIDTLKMEETFMPEEFGHYKIELGLYSENEDDIPQDNSTEMFFNVTDSVFSRTDTTRETSFTTWAWYGVDHEGDYMGSWYTLKEDEEVNSVSVYINHSDILYSIAVSIFTEDPETGEIFELLTSELYEMDSTIIENHWVTIPLDKDGEGEFLEAGKSYMAAVYFTSPMSYEEAYDSRRYSIGSDRSYYYPTGKCWYYFAVDDAWYGSGTDNFMIKMNLNRDENIIDGIPTANALASMDQNYPNPFSHSTTIRFSTVIAQDLQLVVQDISGRTVLSKDLGHFSSGEHQITVDGSGLEAGNYMYTLQGPQFIETKRMIISK